MIGPCHILIAATVFLSATTGWAETVPFAADDDILIVRGRQAGADARFEFLAEGKARLQCVAFSAAGKPLAVENTYAASGFIRFEELDLTLIDQVLCRRQE